MLTQKQRIENFKANTKQIEIEANLRAYAEAIKMLKKGFCERFVANKCMLSIKVIKELKERVI